MGAKEVESFGVCRGSFDWWFRGLKRDLAVNFESFERSEVGTSSKLWLATSVAMV
jgi:hypothetical protein